MSGCAVCNNSGTRQLHRRRDRRETPSTIGWAACLCERGQAKLAAVKSISACIPVSTLDELWPEERPEGRAHERPKLDPMWVFPFTQVPTTGCGGVSSSDHGYP